jgi:hypothetical protein
MNLSISVEKLHEENKKSEYISDPEEALNIVEELRLQSGKFIYEYPIGFRRVIEVIRRK